MALVLNSNRAVFNTGDALSIYDTLSAQDVISTFQARVAADGGEIVDANFLTSVANFLVSNKLLGKVHTIASASLAVKKDSFGVVSKVYNLIGNKDLIMHSRTVTSGVVTDVIGNISRQPLFVMAERPYVNLNTAGGSNLSTASGNILKQDNQQVSSGLGLSVNFVAQRALDDLTQIETLQIFDFGKSTSEVDQVLHGQVRFSEGAHDLMIQVFSKGPVPVLNSVRVDAPVLKRDNVIHVFAKDGEYSVASTKTSMTSNAFTDKPSSYKISLSNSFTDERSLVIGSRLTSNGVTTMSNLHFYDVFVLRDVKDLETSLLVRNFLDAELRAKFSNR